MIKELIERFKDNFGGVPEKQLFPGASIDKDTIQAYNKIRKVDSTDSFCYAPSVNMLFAQNGKVKACCHNTEFVLGEYPKQSIAEIWKSEAAEELRGYMRNYDLRHGCNICAADMDTKSYGEVRAGHFDSLPRNADYPTMMEFLLTNTCNLECVMCLGEYSSLIRKNRDKLPPLVSPYDKAFIQQLEEFIPHLRETRFSGSGEAFAIDVNYEIWEMIIRLNPKCIIMVQTNGSYLNARIKDILARGNFRIGVSLDSLNKENYESIRLNANFERVMENIQYFSEYSRSKNEKFALALCVMRQNWRELPAFIEFCNANNAVATLHKVWFPVQYGLHSLSSEELSKIYDYLSGFDFKAGTRLEKLNAQHYKYMVSQIKLWGVEALKRENESDYVDALTEAEITEYFKNKLRTQLEMEEVPAGEIPDIVNLCLGKVDVVLGSYGSGFNRVDIFKQIAKVPAGDVLKTLRNLPVETVIQQAKTFLVSN